MTKTPVKTVRCAIYTRKSTDENLDLEFNSLDAQRESGELGARNLNLVLQSNINPTGPSVQRYGWTYRVGDKVMQTVNNYDKDVFNGDIGSVSSIDDQEQELCVIFDGRSVIYDFKELDELVLSYATTVHKSQGSEYPAVIIPIHTQHYMMLQRNLLYTALTRARKLVVLIGTRKAVAMAVKRVQAQRRVTSLQQRLSDAAIRPLASLAYERNSDDSSRLAAESPANYGRHDDD
jgi:exodeoxyribonuclease V alpha subunit